MKIVYIIPGSGATFYCENCMRDVPLIRALKTKGVEVIRVPLYLPLFSDESGIPGDIPVFFGAVNMYLKYRYPGLRRMPGWFGRLLDSRPVLKLAARFSGSTSAAGLEAMTLGMLSGDLPYLDEDIRALVRTIADCCKPDVIHLSNALLVGLGLKLKDEFGSKLVCTLQDEDVWIDAMAEPYRTRGWSLLSEASKRVDAYFPVSAYFERFMRARLNGDARQTVWSVLPNGIETGKYASVRPSFAPPVLGYLSRESRGNGLDLLVDAFLRLKEEPALRDLKLRITGGSTGVDSAFIRSVRRNLRRHERDVEFIRHFGFEQRLAFFEGLSVLSVPMEKPEAFGMSVLEALAAGVPVVQPAIGAFPELVAGGGGLLYQPDAPDAGASGRAEALADALRRALADRAAWVTMSRRARETVTERYSLDRVAGMLAERYAEISPIS